MKNFVINNKISVVLLALLLFVNPTNLYADDDKPSTEKGAAATLFGGYTCGQLQNLALSTPSSLFEEWAAKTVTSSSSGIAKDLANSAFISEVLSDLGTVHKGIEILEEAMYGDLKKVVSIALSAALDETLKAIPGGIPGAVWTVFKSLNDFAVYLNNDIIGKNIKTFALFAENDPAILGDGGVDHFLAVYCRIDMEEGFDSNRTRATRGAVMEYAWNRLNMPKFPVFKDWTISEQNMNLVRSVVKSMLNDVDAELKKMRRLQSELGVAVSNYKEQVSIISQFKGVIDDINGMDCVPCAEHEKWRFTTMACECIEGYTEDQYGDCIKELDCDRNEHWDEYYGSCECNEGYTEDEDGECIKVKDCDENEYWDIDEGDCECVYGYSEDKHGDCIEIEDCDENEYWDVDEGECVCNDGYVEDENGICIEDKELHVKIELTYPVGQSPKVFTTGWIFGAKASVKVGDEPEKDISGQVQWSGNGTFSPAIGSVSSPTLRPGRNTINLSVTIDGQTFTEKFRVKAVSPTGYARVGDKAYCVSHAHGCPACPHTVIGPIITGSPNVLIDGLPAARQGDTGVHSACCGPNTFEIVQGDGNVLINGRPAARIGHKTLHCSFAAGNIVEASFTITECDHDKNERWDPDKEECVCQDGYEEDDDGECVKKHDCPDNEEWSDTVEDCVCIEGYAKNDNDICVPEEELEEEEEEEEDDVDICSLDYIQSLSFLLEILVADTKLYETELLSYISKFNKEINDQSSDPCENSIIAYCYYSAKEIAARMAENVSAIHDIAVEIIMLQAMCPDLSQQMQSQGMTIKGLISNIAGLASYQTQLDQMKSRLQENGCDEEEVEDEGEKIVPPEEDPGFIQDGGTSTEYPGDGDDNDGDGQQDEEVEALSGYNVTLVLYDSGSAKDDVFQLSVSGYGNLGQTPAGGLRSYGLNLVPGTYTATVYVTLAPDNVGTYTLNVLYDGESIGSISGQPPQGSTGTLTFTVPSE